MECKITEDLVFLICRELEGFGVVGPIIEPLRQYGPLDSMLSMNAAKHFDRDT